MYTWFIIKVVHTYWQNWSLSGAEMRNISFISFTNDFNDPVTNMDSYLLAHANSRLSAIQSFRSNVCSEQFPRISEKKMIQQKK